MKFHTLDGVPAMRLLLVLLCLALPAASHKTSSGDNDAKGKVSFLDSRDKPAGSANGTNPKFFWSVYKSLFGKDATKLECNNNFVPNDDVEKVIKESGDQPLMLETDTCFTPDVKSESIDSCLWVGDRSKPAVYLVGDSHATVLQQGLKDSISWQLGYVAFANTRLPDEIDNILESLDKVVKPRDVVIWAENFCVLQPNDYETHIEKLKSLTSKTNVVLLGDVQSLPQQPTLCALRNEKCIRPRPQLEKQRQPFMDAIAKASEDSPNKIWALNLLSDLCTADQCNMYIPGTKTLGFMDRDHINRPASDFLGYKICVEMQKKLKDQKEESLAK